MTGKAACCGGTLWNSGEGEGLSLQLSRQVNVVLVVAFPHSPPPVKRRRGICKEAVAAGAKNKKKKPNRRGKIVEKFYGQQQQKLQYTQGVG